MRLLLLVLRASEMRDMNLFLSFLSGLALMEATLCLTCG